MTLFGRSNPQIDALTERINLLEISVGMTLPRIGGLETQCTVLSRSINRLEARLDKELQRRRQDDDDIDYKHADTPMHTEEPFQWPVAPPHEPQLAAPAPAAAPTTGATANAIDDLASR